MLDRRAAREAARHAHDDPPLAAALRAEGFTGRLVEPGDPGYDAARAGWNGAIDRFPAAVAYATDADDVAAAIRARRAGSPIRGGGHSVSGRSVRDGALCIDLRALNARRGRPGARHRARRRRRAAVASSTRRRRSTVWPCPAGRSRTPAWAG